MLNDADHLTLLETENAILREALEGIFINCDPARPWPSITAGKALFSTPLAAEQVERDRKRDEALKAAHHELTTLHGLWACDGFESYDSALESGSDANGAWDVFTDQMWQIDTSVVIKAVDDALGQKGG